MPLQIANPTVLSKLERLARATGLSEIAVVERAVDHLLIKVECPDQQAQRFDALLARLDRVPDRPDSSDPLEWDESGLPK